MDNQEVISVDHVSMRFNLASEKVDSFKEYIICLLYTSDAADEL